MLLPRFQVDWLHLTHCYIHFGIHLIQSQKKSQPWKWIGQLGALHCLNGLTQQAHLCLV